MKSTEIRPSGDFNSWDIDRLKELYKGLISKSVGQILLHEDQYIRLWRITLLPNERLPFHRHSQDYSWTCLTDGSARSHYSDGRIVDLEYVKGDLSFYNHESKDDFVHDLENIGPAKLEFVTVEYLKQEEIRD